MFKVLQGAVQRANKRMAEELEVVVEQPQLPPPPPPPPPSPTGIDRFRMLEEEAAFVLEYLEGVETYEEDRSSLSESRVYALKDKLKSLDIRIPVDNLDEMAQLLGLIKNGNLDAARDEFGWF